MGRLRRFASVVTITGALAAAGLAAIPSAQAGVAEEPTEPPAAYTVDGVAFPEACALQRLDLGSGAVTPLSAPPSAEACVIDLAVAPDGSVWGVGPAGGEGPPDPAFLVHFDPETGAVLSSATITGSFTEPFLQFGGLAFDGVGTLYAQLVTDEPGCDDSYVCLYTVDRSTAVATFVANPGEKYFETALFSLAADCGASMLTVDPVFAEGAETSWEDPAVSGHDDAESLAAYDRASGLLTEVAHFADPDQFVVGLDYARSDGTLFALLAPRLVPGEEGAAADDVYPAAFAVSLYTVDPATAAVTLVAPLSAPEANIATLGIAGTCPAPPPIVLEPTFTG